MKPVPDFSFEIATGFRLIAGVDEAGRGPLCGPVVAAAVIFKTFDIPENIKITDSKQMNAISRASAYEWIAKNTIWAIGQCSPSEIDEMNILHASMLAMRRSIDNLECMPEYALIDGNRLPPKTTGLAIVKGDCRSISIAAASILAKVTRDKIMHDLARQFPEYGWDKNSGYPTTSHLQAIKKYGINEHYRKTYKPIKGIIDGNS